jgi:hypothetical protein
MNLLRLVAGVTVLLATLTTVVAVPPQKPVPPQFGEPTAFVVGMNEYTAKEYEPLKHSVPNATALAKRLAALGYRVTLVTDTASSKLAKDAVGQQKIELLSADEDIDLEGLWNKWVKARFLDPNTPRSPFGVVAFSGHGEERTDEKVPQQKGSQYFLAAKDGPKGGIRVRGLQDFCGQRDLPVVMLMNTCRNREGVKENAELRNFPQSASPSTVLKLKYAGNRFRLMEPGDGPLTFWATDSDGLVRDQPRNMFAMLAEGLEEVAGKQQKTFAARRRREQRGGADGRETDLSLITWFQYTGFRDPKADGPAFVLEPGSVGEQMIFACTDRVRQKKLLALARTRVPLIEGWKWGAGEFTGERTSEGVMMGHPATADKVRYVIGVLEKEYETANKTLVLECVALPPVGVKALGSSLGVLVQPSDDGGDYHFSGWNKRIDLPYGKTTVLKIPLDKGGANRNLTRLSFSAPVGNEIDLWPQGAKLLVTRMDLCDNELAKEAAVLPAEKPIDLLPRWWVGDTLRTTGSKVKLSGDAGDGRGLLLAGGGGDEGEWYGWGGAVFPKVYADPSVHAIEVTLGDAGVKGDTKLTVGVYAGKTVMGEKTVTLAAGKIGQPFQVELSEAGLPDYLAVTADAAELKVKVVKVQLINKPAKK